MSNVQKRLLECGHRAPAKDGAGATWCPIDNVTALVVDEPVHTGATPTSPVERGTAAAVALATR